MRIWDTWGNSLMGVKGISIVNESNRENKQGDDQHHKLIANNDDYTPAYAYALAAQTIAELGGNSRGVAWEQKNSPLQ